MAGYWTDKYSYITGVATRQDIAFFALGDDSIDLVDLPHSQFVSWQSTQWANHGFYEWITVGIALATIPNRRVIALGPMGQILIVGGGDLYEEEVRAGEDTPGKRGPMRCLTSIEGKAFAAGMGRQVYRREDVNRWVCIDQDMRPVGEEVVGFEAIDGFSISDIYAVGWHGEIWSFDGRQWRRAASPTNLILTNVCCGGDGQVYACGRRGLLICGRNERWRVIDHGVTDEDFWGISWFNNTLFLASMRFIFSFDGTNLTRVHTGPDIPGSCYHLTAAEGCLWSIGKKDVVIFDGRDWTRID